MSAARVAAVIAALSAVGLCRTAWFHFIVEPHVERPIPGPPIDDQFRALVPLLPRSGEVGYVTDEPILLQPGRELQGAKQRFLQMQYSLAPVILRYDQDRLPLVIVNVADPQRLSDVLRSHALTVVTQVAPNLAVAEPP